MSLLRIAFCTDLESELRVACRRRLPQSLKSLRLRLQDSGGETETRSAAAAARRSVVNLCTRNALHSASLGNSLIALEWPVIVPLSGALHVLVLGAYVLVLVLQNYSIPPSTRASRERLHFRWRPRHSLICNCDKSTGPLAIAMAIAISHRASPETDD